MTTRPLIAAAVVLAMYAICRETASAQTVRGRVLDRLSGLPASRGFVVLVNEAGREAGRALSDREGRFTLQAPAPGRYRLRSERIGYLLWTSEEIELLSGQVLSLTLHVEPIPIRLEAVEVSGKGTECSSRATEGESLAMVWEELRKALNAAVWTASTRPYFYVRRFYEQTMGAGGHRVIRETERADSGSYSDPFRSAPAGYLAAEGYIVQAQDSFTYYAPDAKLLLDDAFLDGHCLRLIRQPTTRDGMIGLVFEPLPSQRRPDVKGVLWVDERSSKLEALEFSYVGGAQALTRGAGGDVQFQGLPSGEWVVRAWRIRTPVLVERTFKQFGILVTDTTLIGVRQHGGEVLRITGAQDSLVYTAKTAALAGIVFDSVGVGTLEGAVVVIVGTAYSTRTGPSGRFRLSVPLEGEYGVTFSHAGLDSVGSTPDTVTASLSPGGEVSVTLVARSLGRVLRRLCGRLGKDERVLFGTVRHAVDGMMTAAGARVFATWDEGGLPGVSGRLPDVNVEAVTDRVGRYVLCGLPIERRIRVHAVVGNDKSEVIGLQFGTHTLTVGQLAIPAPARPTWTLDLDVIPKGRR